MARRTFDADDFDAVLFDLDGVLTPTASLHATSWKTMFDTFLRERAGTTGEDFEEFDIERDYKVYVDGKPRLDGVRSFLQSRGIELPAGDPKAPASYDTVAGLGKHKNELFQKALAEGDIDTFEGALAFVRYVRSHQIRTAVVSSSHNCEAVLQAADIDNLFDTTVDGNMADRLKLAGKPKPDMFLKAAEELEVEPAVAVVIEDAIAGVQAGRAGGFGLVVGVLHGDNADALLQNGADLVVHDLSELLP